MSSCLATGSGYDPSSAVEAFHDIPHIDIDLQDSPEQFDPSNSKYWEAIIIWACLPILTCVCIFILMSIYFLCVCCCCCCGGSFDWTKKPKIACGIINFSIIVVLLALIGVSFWAEVELTNNIHDLIDIGGNTEDFFNQYGDESTLYTEAMQNQSLGALHNELSVQNPRPNGSLEDVNDLNTSNGALGVIFADINDQVEPIDLDNVIDVADEFENTRHWVVIAYLCLVTVVLILVIVAILCGICIASPVFLIIMVIILVIVTVITWTATGGSLAFLVVSADICHDPDMLIRNHTQDQKDAVNQSVVNYYIVCNETCQPNPFTNLVNEANAAFTLIQGFEVDLQEYISNNTENKSILQPLLNEVVRGFNGSMTAVNDISSCVYIHDTYLDSLQAFCTDAFDSAVVQFSMVCALSVLLMVLVVTLTFHAGFFCNRKKEYDEEAVAYEFPPPTSGPSVWESYGTNVNYNSAYSRFREQSPHLSGAIEPPQYNDLQPPTTGERSSTQFGHELRQLSNSNDLPHGSHTYNT